MNHLTLSTNMTTHFEQILHGYGITSSNSKRQFIEKTTFKNYPKFKDLLLEGKINDKEYLLVEGVMHRYNVSDKGNIVTTGFYMSKQVITPHFARIHKGRSLFSLQTLTDVVIAEIPVIELDRLRHEYSEFRNFGQLVLENALAQTFFNEVVFRTYNAKERLLAMRNQFPNLENLVPHHFIASYLGITKVSFSRLRNELANK